jgi:hypothetical protein
VRTARIAAPTILTRSTVWSTLASGVFLALVVGAVVLVTRHINRASGDVIYADTWTYIEMIGHFLSGRLSLAELYSSHNESRPIVLNIILLMSAKFDHLNLIHVEYLSIVFSAITVGAIMYFCRGMFDDLLHALFVFALIRPLMFSLAQWENWLLPINIAFFASVTFLVCSILLMHRQVIRRSSKVISADFAASVLLSVLALFSMGGGIVVWIVKAIQILLVRMLFGSRTVASGGRIWGRFALCDAHDDFAGRGGHLAQHLYPRISSSLCSCSAAAGFASLPPKILAPAFSTKTGQPHESRSSPPAGASAFRVRIKTPRSEPRPILP